MSSPTAGRSALRSTLPIFGIGLLVLLGSTISRRMLDRSLESHATAHVRRGEFVRTIPAQGDVATYQPSIVYSNVRRRQQPEVIYVAEQGQWVEAGELVCVLDASEFKLERFRPVLAVIADDARVIKAEATEGTQELRNERRLDQIGRQAMIDEELLLAYEGAEYENLEERLASQVELNAENFGQSTSDFQHTQNLSQQGIVTTTQLARENARLQRSSRELELAEGRLELLKQFQNPRSLAQLRFNARNSQREIKRAELQNDVETAMAELSTLSFRKYRAGWQEYVDHLTRSIDACEMRAPKSGEVVLLHGDEPSRRIEIGRRVHYKQPVFAITDRSQLTVSGHISDRFSFVVKEGQRAEAWFDALPGRRFAGEVTWVASYSKPLVRKVPDVRVNQIEILLDRDSEADKLLFPGMTANVEITVDARTDVLQVPAQAVAEYGGSYVVVVDDGNGSLTLRVVEIGESDDMFVEIVSGLEEGELTVIKESAEELRQLIERIR